MSGTSLQRGLKAWMEEMDAPMATFFSSCVHCGICAEACLFYTETKDPKYTPIHKLEPMRRFWKQEFTLVGRLLRTLGLSRPVSDQELEEWEPLVYDSCTLCGRCSTACPVGNDITYMIRKTREGFAAAGHVPPGMVGAAGRAIRLGSPMGVKLSALMAQIGHIEEDSGLKIPLDQEGADYMALLSSMEIMNFPEYLEALARIFDQAGVSWTLCSDAFEATNSGVQIGSKDIARELLQRVVDGAERLKVKYVISPECGHAYFAIRWEGPNLIGRKFGFKVVHILELLDQLRAEGRLKLEGRFDERLSFHDPCQIVRKGGVVEEPRNLIGLISNNFVEMADSRQHNWCCGGGGGVSSNERADDLRLKVFSRKKSQLDAVRPDTLVTACANCRLMLEDGLEEYHMDIPVTGLTEMIAAKLAPKKQD